MNLTAALAIIAVASLIVAIWSMSTARADSELARLAIIQAGNLRLENDALRSVISDQSEENGEHEAEIATLRKDRDAWKMAAQGMHRELTREIMAAPPLDIMSQIDAGMATFHESD